MKVKLALTQKKPLYFKFRGKLRRKMLKEGRANLSCYFGNRFYNAYWNCSNEKS